MSLSTTNSLWHAVEALPGLGAVEAEWRAAAGPGFDRLAPLLRVRPGLAASYPRPGGLPYEVREPAPGEYVGVCPDHGEPVPLTRGQLLVLEVDRAKLAAALARAFGLDPAGAGGPEDPLPVGTFASAAGVRYGCFFVTPTESADVQVVATRLVAEGAAPFVVFVPTRRFVRRATETLLRYQRCAVVALCEAVAVDGPGRWSAAEPLDAVLARATGVASVAPAAPEGRPNAFRFDGTVWSVTFQGTTVGLTDGLGPRYLARLIASKRIPVDAAVLQAAARGKDPVPPGAGFAAFDQTGWEACRARYSELTEELEDATARNDAGRRDRVREEMAALAGELRAAHGFGGRDRKRGDKSASVRTAVKNALDRTLKILKDKHGPLFRHLDAALRTGAEVCYDPNPDVDWEV
ncbi:Uncharacterized protein OS=Isosphaera pallida (strain ATCC 43644 / DSM 9630 / IS1B) GN=Isop_2458 PE=4 SV=1 [Gemmataceae bacterium]|nr:Uncharacterized protein OS=Isosphaera pallida (strain ATCC 43644 / DSM 9630 / IS1B) GN=Isop_2458 PE=4 SV=1 [Gemmataceae bacterium]VTU02478.1 Uncharacterized protein OS=Isosphaera pallida (strain ATCC 43644 / DSM 9630 / IS1B) GN=Isop_2458 PE=4 SV=1 [Gemmataceae bacterium]